VLVIGGGGYIGNFLVPRLIDAGHEVTVFHRADSTTRVPDGVRVIHGDRRQLANSAPAIRESRPDVVIDLILSSGQQASELLDVVRGHTGRVVAISSADVYRAVGIMYGSESGPLEPTPLTEDSPLRTKLQTYPAAQVRALQSIFHWLDDAYDKIPVERAILEEPAGLGVVLRLPMIYGPGDRLHRLFPMLKRIDDGRPFLMFAKSVAGWRAPRGYVENVAAAIAQVALALALPHRVYNIAEPDNSSELEWAREVAAAAGWRGEIVVVEDADAPLALRPPGNLAQDWGVDSTRIRTDLGYVEPVARPVALARTIAWEREHPGPVVPAAFDYAADDAAAQRPGTRRIPIRH
jgi:nucleoside-diphosphate-sugar epimerase